MEDLMATRTAELKRINQLLRQEIAERRTTEEKLIIYQDHLRSLASELSLAEERQRRQIATGLHDSVGQSLAMVKIKLKALQENPNSPNLTQTLEEIHQLIDKSIQQVRTLTFELSPPVLYEVGLEGAVEWQVEQMRKQYGLKAQLYNDKAVKPLKNDLRIVLFQAVRELLFNIVKHAKCTQVKVDLRREGNLFHIRLEDNGIGFEVKKVFPNAGRKKITTDTSGFGLFNVRERLTHLGGVLEIDSAPGKGTRVILTAPLKTLEA